MVGTGRNQRDEPTRREQRMMPRPLRRAGSAATTANGSRAVTVIRASVISLSLMTVGSALAGAQQSGTEREFNAVLQRKADTAHGKQTFDTCAACHGTQGAGASDGSVPAIAGQHLRVIVWELVQLVSWGARPRR